MWRWAISSDCARTLVLALALALTWAGAGGAKVFLTVDEALALAFPGCAVEPKTVYLTAAQLARARELAGVEIASAMVRPYRANCQGRAAGAAYFDSHRVRTLPETLMVVVTEEGSLQRLEVLSFREPEDYIPRDTWYDQFEGRELDGELSLKRGVRAVTGATLTARATTDAVRRVLAIHRVIATEKAE